MDHFDRSATSGASAEGDQLDLRSLILPIWQHRRLVLFAGLVGAVLGVGQSLFSARYHTEALFQTPGLSVDAYKRHETALLSGRRLAAFVAEQHTASPDASAVLAPLAAVPGALRASFTPVFAFTEADQRAFGVRPTGDADALVGIRIELTRGSRYGNAEPLALLGEYIRDTLIRVDMDSELLKECQVFRTQEQTLRNQQIRSDFEVAQQQARIEALRAIISRTPGAAGDTGSLLSIEAGNERFLSPVAQLVAAEVRIADEKLAGVARERERAASELKRNYYCEAQKTLSRTSSGRHFLDELTVVLTQAFNAQDRGVDIVEHTWNELDVQRKRWQSQYIDGMRFVSTPEEPSMVVRQPGLIAGAVLGFTAAVFAGVLFAYARSWWIANRSQIVVRHNVK